MDQGIHKIFCLILKREALAAACRDLGVTEIHWLGHFENHLFFKWKILVIRQKYPTHM